MIDGPLVSCETSLMTALIALAVVVALAVDLLGAGSSASTRSRSCTSV